MRSYIHLEAYQGIDSVLRKLHLAEENGLPYTH